MADKKYPVLYATSVKGTIFRHCGIYNTIYFNIYNNKELEDKPYYLEYMEETREEVYKAIQNKFTMSQPLKVTNDHKVFIIFRGNVDMRDVKTFCKMMLQELEYFTEGVHKADYAELETMFMEIGRAPTFMKASKVGEKLTQTDILDKIMVRMDGHDQPQDNGCLTPYTDYVDFKEIVEPLRLLFKDEVRKAGRELGIPEYLVSRQPFPGPGLGIRIVGEVTAEKVKIVQDADYIYREEIAKAGLDKGLGQYFAALTNMRSVGVMGDERTYDYAVALRAVCTSDFMTADCADIPFEVLQRVMTRIINEVKGVNRVMYDLTSKPPGTIEFE